MVVVKVGNSYLRFHYSDAFKIAQFIRVKAKEAKRRAGDIGQHWNTLAILEDLKK